jgi:copper chaperone CopZ
MTCASCVRRVEKALLKVEGLRSIAVDIPAKTVRVQFDETTVSIDRIARAVEEDYPVASVA